jgi:hypothetical protein
LTSWQCSASYALDVVAEESPLQAALAASPRATQALATDDLVGAEQFTARTAEMGAELAEPDVEACCKSRRHADADGG